jgi:AraC family transcriptional regulator
MLEVRHSCAARLPRHSHAAAYLCLLLEGSYRETIGQTTLAYRPFTLAFHPPGLTHHDEIGPSGARFFNVEVDSARLATLSEDRLSSEATPGEVRDPLAVALILVLYREYCLLHDGDGAINALHVESTSLELLAASIRARMPAERWRPAWLTRVVERLHEDRAEAATVTELARAAAVHPVHLARTFRRVHGCTMGQYRARLRIQRACALLTSRDVSLAHIAAEVGFADQSHLTRVFAGVVGCAPSTYRRLLGSPGSSPEPMSIAP